ncbi:MAG: hypothetical protein M3N28_08900 [Actinomycetota bacterium]|nr:hypothetical protein [Actinomycetota bacterium]
MATETEAWCEACQAWREEDECPACGQVLVDEEPPPVPWHFKFLVVATVLYLAWRAVQLVVWWVG